jgi:hypothetical protein
LNALSSHERKKIVQKNLGITMLYVLLWVVVSSLINPSLGFSEEKDYQQITELMRDGSNAIWSPAGKCFIANDKIRRFIESSKYSDSVGLIDNEIKVIKKRNDRNEIEKLRICFIAAFEVFPQAKTRISDFLRALNKNFPEEKRIGPDARRPGGAFK